MPDQPSLVDEPQLRECGQCGAQIPEELDDVNCPACGVPPGEEPSAGGEHPDRSESEPPAPGASEAHTPEDSPPPAEEPEPDAPPRCPECKRFIERGKHGWKGHRRGCPRAKMGPDDEHGAPKQPPSTEEQIEAAAVEVLGPAEAAAQPSREIDYYRPEDLTVASGEDVFRVMDAADEDQILSELQDRLTGIMVYSFEQDGQKITDLSYEGITECARTLNARGFTRMRVAKDVPPRVEEFREDGIDYVRASVYVEDERTGGGDWGIATEPKRMQLKANTAARWRKNPAKANLVDDEGRVWDKFALTKALSKAKRNAYRSLIPLQLRQVLIAQFLGDPSKVRTLRQAAGSAAVAEMPAPLVTEEAEERRQRARELFSAIRDVHPTAYMIPGAFNALLVRHEHDLTRLDEFIAQLEGLLERAQKERDEKTGPFTEEAA